MMRCWLLTFEEGFLKDEVVDVEAAGEASVVVGEAHIAGLLQREQLLHLQSMTFFDCIPCCCIAKKIVGECSALCRYEVVGITFGYFLRTWQANVALAKCGQFPKGKAISASSRVPGVVVILFLFPQRHLFNWKRALLSTVVSTE